EAARRAAVAAAERAAAERQKAEAAEAQAKSETALANGVKDFLQRDVLRLADPTVQQEEGSAFKYDADVRLRDVVLRAADKIEGKFGDRPLVEAEIRNTLGRTLYAMGRYDLAEKQFARELGVNRQTLGPGHADTLRSMNNLAMNYYYQGRYADAAPLFEE